MYMNRTKNWLRVLIINILLFVIYSLPAQNKVKVYHFTLSQEIMPAAKRHVTKAISEAEKWKADYIIVSLNTYGGMVDVADTIRTRLLKTKPTTIVFIQNNAASAGALIALSCDSIYMAKGASIGAATVVNESGEKLPDKYQSYMRSKMRSTAETQGRNPTIAEGMVDESIYIAGIKDTGKILTFTTEEAIKYDFCDGLAENFEEALKNAGVTNYELKSYQPTAIDAFISFLLNPIVNSILLLMIVGGIFYEMKAPGIGFALGCAIVGAILYFAPLYLEGLAKNWEILVFLAGLILLALEIFVIPGFGIAGISGILCIIIGLGLALIDNDKLNFEGIGMLSVGWAFFRVTAVVFFGLIFFLIFGKSMFESKALAPMILKNEETAHHGFSVARADYKQLGGKEGVALTDLRPSGKVSIEEEVYDALTMGEYITKGTAIKVVKHEGYSIVVKQV